LRLALKWVLRFLGALAGLVAAYFLAAFVLVLFPRPTQPDSAPVVVNAFVYSNGVHTDLVFPIKAQGVDWSQAFPVAHLPQVPHDAAYIAIGWGDREFYLNTPRWQDLTASRALHALSGSGRTLLHVNYLRETDLQSGMHALPLSARQYASLVNYVERALVRSSITGSGVNVPGQHYGPHDAFYEANGAYNLFTTCNAWVGRGLAQAGVKVSAWTPLASQVVWHLPPR
jgi:uncharacterized protein (TIGR02117 family)